MAEKIGAIGTDAYSLLAAIGRDCVGALQFVREADEDGDDGRSLAGDAIDDVAIEKMLKGLAQAPLGLTREDDFRISVAGAQEKTALLRQNGKWLKPHGTTPTTHILKPQIGELPNGLDLTNSIENVYYCLRLVAAFGLPVNNAEIAKFGKTTALVIERFDCRWTEDGRLLRLPQEDCCQALSFPPTRKYQSDGGPGLAHFLNLVKGSDTPAEDQAMSLKAQIIFWLIGATDGHAKNFSILLSQGGRFHLTPLCDVLTAQPSLDSGQIQRKQMKLAMSAGSKNHYRIADVQGQHFVQTAEAAGVPERPVENAIASVADQATAALNTTESQLPNNFLEHIHTSVKNAVIERLRSLKLQ